MAHILYADFGLEEVEPKNGTDFSLEEMQSIVGGYIEIVDLNDSQCLVVNEEGKCEHLPYNAIATNVLRLAYQHTTDYIAGNALLCNINQIK